MQGTDGRSGFWRNLHRYAERTRLDSIKFGPATLKIEQGAESGDAFGQLVKKIRRNGDRPNDVFVVSAHNVDDVTIVDEISADHECEALETPQRHMGGAGGNAAYALAMLGAEVQVAGCVGTDQDGQDLLSSLHNAGVGVGLIEQIAGSSGRTQNIVDATGRRLLVVHPNANDAFTDYASFDALEHAARASRVVHLSSFVDERALTFETRLAAAVAGDVVTSLTPGALYARRGLDRLESLLRNIDVMFLYREQLETLLKSSSAPSSNSAGGLQGLLEAYFAWKSRRCIARPQLLVIKDPLRNRSGRLTERFLAVGCGDSCLERFFYPRELPRGADVHCLDTTGAGDAAAAAFLYGMLQGGSLEDCLDAGFLLASFATTAVGARSAFAVDHAHEGA